MWARLGIADVSPPAYIPPDHGFEWAIKEAARLDVRMLGDERPDNRRGGLEDLGYLRHIRQLAADHGIEIEPSVRSPFDLVGAGAAYAREATVASMRAARELGGPVVQACYGNETIAKSRYGRVDLSEHLRLMVDNLREAAQIADAEGLVIAIENHCDFSGREWRTVLEEVASSSLRCKLDFANGLPIYSD